MRRRMFALLALVTLGAAVRAQPDKPKPVFPALPEGDAWASLPPSKPPLLPEWARSLAGPLPKTTAKLLELDYVQRAKNPLGVELAARLRLEVARQLRCKSGEVIAQADLDRAVPDHGRRPQSGNLFDPAYARDANRVFVATRFAKKLTLAGHAITDDEFTEVLKEFGPEKTTAIVHTVAYANFHNRVVLGLGAKGESPVAEPLNVQFDTDNVKRKAPDRPPWDDLKAAKGGGLSVRVEWSDADFDRINANLDKQKERALRIPLPADAVFEKLPPRERDSAKKILWNTVSAGYQPELTRAWFAPLYAFYEEAKVDRVFTNAAFWVVTRTNDCFY